ncbi:MAG: CehA/McbA family metallohydrolase [Clostridia bacterium]|nr:CehA/McbA family metallohydrolase [Clostridia bacterium]
MKWYKCELHCHTVHSDGSMSADTLVDRAARRGYTAIALTDHNTVSGLDSFVAAASKAGIVPIRGIEWTTFYGHITVLGVNDVNWREVSVAAFDDCVQRAAEQGAAVNIAHPDRWGFPVGAGCHFEYAVGNWSNVAGMEVYWGLRPHVSEHCARALARWRGLICGGEKISALYGYDWHKIDDDVSVYGATYLGIDGAPSEASCIAAVREGRTFVSLIGNADIRFISGGVEYAIGDSVPVGAEGIVKIKLDGRNIGDNLTLNVFDFASGDTISCDIVGNKAEIGYIASNTFGITVSGSADGCAGDVIISSPIYVEGGKV